MRPVSLILCIAAITLAAVPAQAGQMASRRLSGWLHITTPDGWTGRRYMEGNLVFAEEFDSNGDGRIDIWRFYRRGFLSSEERDLNGDGMINYQSRWEGRQGRLVSVMRDTNGRGVYDLEIETTGRNRWEIKEDRNQDGITDRILILNGPADLFERLGIDLAVETDIVDAIPQDYWVELRSDDNFTGDITDYYRYSRGALNQYGQWNGSQVAWSRVDPDFVPGPPGQMAGGDFVPPASDPFSDPYGAPAVTVSPWPDSGVMDGGQAAAQPGDPFADPYADPFSDPFADPYGQAQAVPADPAGPPVITDRTRYDGLPPGDSAARSLPARMRPPGVTRRAP